MDELTALAQLRADVPDPTPEALRAARTRLEDQDVRAAVLVPRPRRLLRRRALIGVAAAVALAAASYAVTTGDGDRSPSAGGTLPASQANPRPGTSAAPRYVDAAALLDAAAANALRADGPALGPGQYRYFRSHSYLLSTIDSPPNQGAYVFSENRDEIWTPASAKSWTYIRSVTDIAVHYASASQRRYAASVPGGIPSRAVYWDVQRGDGDSIAVFPPSVQNGRPPRMTCVPEPCSATFSVWDAPDRQSVAKLPRDPAALRKSLFAWATAQAADASKYHKRTRVGSIALGAIETILDQDLATGEVRSTLFQVAKSIPGITLFHSMANYDGKRGLAVGLVDPFGVRQSLIFDTDGSYLGEREVVTRPSSEYQLPAGTVIAWTANTVGVSGKPTLPKAAKMPH